MAGPQDENAGLTGLARDAFGLSHRGQMAWMQWQLFHMPSTWRRKTGPWYTMRYGEAGFRWRGPIAGRFVARPLEAIYGRITGGGGRIPFISPLLRGTPFTPFEGVSPFDLGAARRILPGTDILGLRPEMHREFAARGEQLFGREAGRRRYIRALREVFTGGEGRVAAERFFGAGITEEMGAAARGLYRRPAARLLASGVSRIMFPLTIGLNFATVASLSIGLGTMMGRQAVGLINKLTATDVLDFGTGTYAASMFQASVTERQRALQTIQRNNLNARRYIGNEAALLHS